MSYRTVIIDPMGNENFHETFDTEPEAIQYGEEIMELYVDPRWSYSVKPCNESLYLKYNETLDDTRKEYLESYAD